MERRIINRWKKEKTFEASVTQRPPEKAYVFYDGPPFITGLPHHGTLLSSIVKDVIPRFWTMLGYRVERQWGWDCHGLPAENLVEQKLNLKDKQAVLDYGLEKYILACRENMIQTGSLWEESIERIGRWVEFKKAYKTMDASFMESVWWAFKQLYEKGQIYEGEKVLMYCTRCATPVSKAEIAMDHSYQEVRDLSVYVKFALNKSSLDILNQRLNLSLNSQINFLAWTTTPWTLPANTALACHPHLNYVLVNIDDQHYILCQDLVIKVLVDDQQQPLNYQVVATFAGQKLEGLFYEPLFEPLDHPAAFKVVLADYVAAEEGTGLVHLAPAYGEEDYQLAASENLAMIQNVNEHGCYETGVWQNQYIGEVGDEIIAFLLNKGRLLRTQIVKHSYPHCHRCQTRLIYKAHPSWFLDIACQKEKMLADNQQINWFPAHIKDRRFTDVIKSAPDWNISRDRMWATPLPVWRGLDERTGQQKTIVVGSYQELEDLSGQRLEDYHRPWVDEITFEKEGVLYRRVDKVLDCWFESGSMSFAQHHYPFVNEDLLESNFPADFIVEYVGQVRTWFYYLHVLGVALFGKSAFSNVIVTGTILGNDGRKLSKSLGNYTDPLELIEAHSADAYRLVLVNSPVLAGEDFSLTTKDITDKQRKLDTLRNALEFFLLYASADNWQVDPQAPLQSPKNLKNIFDRWLLVQLSHLQQTLTSHLKAYNLPGATEPVLQFIDDLSNWYIRRNRKRFWKTDSDEDKEQAYQTLYFTLRHLARLIAPLCPFLAEEIETSLTSQNPSVHLANWPHLEISEDEIVRQMTLVRQYITAGLALRAEAGLKVRQPLAAATCQTPQPALSSDFENIILEELNLKTIKWQADFENLITLDTNITDDLKAEGLIRDLVRHIQALRKKAALEVENRIVLNLRTEDPFVLKTLADFSDYICTETLATDFIFGSSGQTYLHPEEIKIQDKQITISLQAV